MKKVFAILAACILAAVPALSCAEANRFVHEATGISLEVPEGWNDVPNTSGNPNIIFQVAAANDMSATIGLQVTDYYTSSGLSAQGKERKDAGFDLLSEEMVRAYIGNMPIDSVEVKQEGDYRYYAVNLENEFTSKTGSKYTMVIEMDITLCNGYIFYFVLMAGREYYGTYYPVYEAMLQSVRIEE